MFRYEPPVLERFPAVVGGVLHAAGVRGGPTPPQLHQELVAEAQAARARVSTTPLSEIPALAAWRRAFRAFDVDPTQYRSAAEALLRRVSKGDDLPSINLLVDLANLVSIRRALPVAVFDRARLTGTLAVRFADGSEPWADLGSSASERPNAGEVVFVDDAGVVHARRWCWRQSAASAARDDTSEILVTVEGHHEAARADVEAALTDIEALLRKYAAPVSVRRGLVTAEEPAFR